MVQVSVVSMELSVEDTFKNELYKKYESPSQHHHTEESHTWTEDNNLGVT
jgi:hypothetical protein